MSASPLPRTTRSTAAPASARSIRDAQLTELIGKVHADNYGVYGVRKVWAELKHQGHQVARCTVQRLMRSEGLSGAVRGNKIRTTVPGERAVRAPDLVDRDFVAPAPPADRVRNRTRRGRAGGRPPALDQQH
ncbi:IS3 family transposase [Streptomyces peucetius]